MGDFWSALGNVAGNYAKSKLLGKVGADPNQSLANSIYSGYQRYRTNRGNQNLIQDPATAAGASAAYPFDPSASVEPPPEPMGGGKVVTQPTLAIIGDKGPERVVPLTPSPNNKVNPTQLETQSIQPGAMVGQGGARARYRHVGSANALARQRPISADLPLVPNKAVR